MQIGERHSYQFTSKLGSFRTAYQHFPASPPSLNAQPADPSPTAAPPPAIICIHGFGGNADQFRYNMPVWARGEPGVAPRGADVYGLDLLGYGYGDRPSPRDFGRPNALYNFETWAAQVCGFVEHVAAAGHNSSRDVFLVCNSIGGIVGLLAGLQDARIKGVVLINVSMRMLHTQKQNPLQRLLVPPLQFLLRETPLGRAFFANVAQPATLRAILRSCYGEEAPDEALRVLAPALILQDPRTPEVFLDFVSYSHGPLAEDLLDRMRDLRRETSRRPAAVHVLWGARDSWEDGRLARRVLGGKVRAFRELPGAGHCPMDQVPALVNREVWACIRDSR
eukprot:gene32117-38839_t